MTREEIVDFLEENTLGFSESMLDILTKDEELDEIEEELQKEESLLKTSITSNDMHRYLLLRALINYLNKKGE
ncbi:MAG: hypothetical protein LBD41_04430 [Clostridiales Family XIII bacterium]|jgi:hypothetical protein|nr:hypothetical protein [Clostridiales Family XIII bacterium]